MPRKPGDFWLVGRDQRREGRAQLADAMWSGPKAKPALIQHNREAPVSCGDRDSNQPWQASDQPRRAHTASEQERVAATNDGLEEMTRHVHETYSTGARPQPRVSRRQQGSRLRVCSASRPKMAISSPTNGGGCASGVA